MKRLKSSAPLHRVPVWLAEDVHRAVRQLQDDDADFLDPELAAAQGSLVGALDRFSDELGGMFDPEHEGADYFEVPPEWKRTQRTQYYEMLSSLEAARTGFLSSYKEWVNAMNRQGKLPSETTSSGTQQKIEIRSGDNSPVNVYAPHAQASGGGTASANVTTNQPSDAAADSDYPKSFWGNPKIIGIGTVLLVLIGLIALYPVFFPSK